MKLITKEIQKILPPLYAQEDISTAKKMVYAKFFTPWSNWTWYVMEYDPKEKLCFGYVKGFENELGYFSLEELENLKGPHGLTIERDLYFKPCKWSEVV
ncbi:MAG: hypothetical protein BWY78_01371 [Alphaproteobacteria bacterium ADurb.Bin438]|nr:MAG: hypothetical protein BWY78_01371 [Alphaproteobacteria bacterium ADurb.Bin438]